MIDHGRFTRLGLGVLASLLLAACGGASGPGAYNPPPPPPPTPTPSPAPSGNPGPTVGTASLRFTAPRNGSSRLRAPRAGTAASLVVTIVSIDGNTTLPANVAATTVIPLSSAPGGNCTVAPATGESCVVAIPAPVGKVAYVFQVKDEQGHVLAVAAATFTVPATPNPSFTATLGSVVTFATITPPSFNAGTASSGPLGITYNDATGAPIVGAPFANAVTITDNDASPDTQLSLNGGTPGKTVTVTSPNDVVIINYDGAALAPFTFGATESVPPGPGGFGAGGNCQQNGNNNGNCGGGGSSDGTNPPIAFGGAATISTIPGFPNSGQPTVFFVGYGSAYQPQTFTVTQGKKTKTYDVDATACAGIATVSPASDSASFAVTSTGLGICRLDVTEHGQAKDLTKPSRSASIYVSVTGGLFNGG